MKRMICILLALLGAVLLALPCAAAESAPVLRHSGAPAWAVQRLEAPAADGQVPFTAFYHKAWGREALPLVLYFHGAGSVGTTPLRVLFQFLPIAVSLLMQGKRCHFVTVYDAGISHFGAPAFAADVSAYIEYAVQSGNVDESRIYLIGYSYGGSALRNLDGSYPGRFAAAASLEGSEPDNLPVIQVETARPAVSHRPDPAAAQEFLQIPLGGHDLLPLTAALYRPWMDWLFAQRLAVA
jgi:poly(3-hydroxybutyrate) depolymerase